MVVYFHFRILTYIIVNFRFGRPVTLSLWGHYLGMKQKLLLWMFLEVRFLSFNLKGIYIYDSDLNTLFTCLSVILLCDWWISLTARVFCPQIVYDELKDIARECFEMLMYISEYFVLMNWKSKWCVAMSFCGVHTMGICQGKPT